MQAGGIAWSLESRQALRLAIMLALQEGGVGGTHFVFEGMEAVCSFAIAIAGLVDSMEFFLD